MGWLALERAIQVILGGAASIVIVRFLGPVRYGTYSYALALVTLVVTATQLPMPQVVRDLVVNPSAEREIMGTAAVLAIALVSAGVALLALATAIVPALHDGTTLSLVLIFGVTLILRPAVTVDAVFQAELRARQSTLARNIGFSAAAVAQLSVVAAGGNLQALAAATLLNPLLTASILISIYSRHGRSVRRWHFRTSAVMHLAKRSAPWIVATTGVAVYLGIDQVMLGMLSTRLQLGIYSAAVTLSGATYFVPLIFVASIAPRLTLLRNTNPSLYRQRLQQVYTYLAIGATAIILIFEVFGTRIATILFGSQFHAVGSVLSIHIISILFVYFGIGDSVWTVNDGLERLTMYRALGGAAINVLLNLILIPPYGAGGAAWATMISYGMASTVGDALHPVSRPYFLMQLRALSPARWFALLV